jgi:superfamily II DNA/RNA helicase
VDGLHRSLPNVKHEHVPVKGKDKLALLAEVLQQHIRKPYKTLVFCNTIDSCRAVEYYMRDPTTYGSMIGVNAVEDVIDTVACYHGELNSRERLANLDSLRNGTAKYMVCTDIAARGLDIPEIGHIIMFDFPMNPVDYRAARAGKVS